jgi:putative ABC transport system permease protein
MRIWMDDFRVAARTLSRNPGFTVVAVLTLTLGVGINTAISSLVRGTLLAPLPFPQEDRLAVMVTTPTDRPLEYWSAAIPEINDVVESSRLLAGVGTFESRHSPILTGGDRPERPSCNFVTSAYFQVLRARPFLGRTFLPEEDKGIGQHAVAILSHELWQRRFAGDPAIVGSQVVLSDVPYTVVGVMPPGFQDMRRDLERSDLWLPLSMGVPFYGPDMFETRAGRQYLGITRLKDGVSLAAAQAELNQISKRLEKAYPYSNENRVLRLVPLRKWFYGDLQRPVTALAVGAVLVLLICCTNLGMLLLVRGQTRRREIAIRAAVGAARGHLVRQILAESLLLALAGGGLGVLLASWAIRFWRAGGLSLPVFATIRLEPGMLLVTLAATLAVGLVLGLVPALSLYRSDLRQALQSAGRQTMGADRPRSGPSPIVIAEVALAVILLVGAALTAKSLYRLLNTEIGFKTGSLLTMRLEMRGSRYEADEALKLFTEQLTDKLTALPGVAAAVAWGPSMLAEAGYHWRMTPAGMAPSDPRAQLLVQRLHVTPGGLKALGIDLLQGRELTRMDRREPPPYLVVMGERLTQKLWPGEDAVGKGFYLGEDPHLSGLVVGVARDVRHRGRLGSDEEVAGDVYVSLLQRPQRNMALLIRYRGDVAGILKEVNKAVLEMDPDLVLFDVATMDERLARTEASPRLTAALMGMYAAVAIFLAGLGLYGVLSYSVQQRMPELAMRSALGALPRRQLLMVIRQGLSSVLLGVVLGLAGAYLLSRFIESLLFGVSRADPAMYAAVTALLILVALAACYLPARRASRVDPMLLLRGE